MKIMTIAVLKHHTHNIGDDIQRLALEALLPHVDLRIDRDDMSLIKKFDSDTKLIVNGWFAKQTHKVYPIQTKAQVLYIGFHANDDEVIPLKPQLPVGCRDLWTFELCRQKNVPAWLSWCATLTLPWERSIKRNNILLADVFEKDLDSVPKNIIQAAKRVTHEIDPLLDRNSEALKRLELYASAQLVITKRLHAMLPCLAMGTPVVFVTPAFGIHRFEFYRDLAWTPENAPWNEMRPKVSREYINGMSVSFQKTLAGFLKS
jgi:hypothetical protein